jgi:hypothetical protein
MDIILPEWYDDIFEFECEAKGCVLNFAVTVGGRSRSFNFYDISRFTQDAEEEISQYDYFLDEDAVIIRKVTRENIVKFLNSLK